MTTSPWPAGLLTALVTPLQDDEINIEVLGALIDRQIASGVSGLVVGGGTGEYGALAVDERELLATEAIAAVGGRVPVVIQTGALTTRDAVALSVHAQTAGADAILVASPFGEAINWSERYHFYEVLTRAVELPVMVYNTPPSGLLTLDQIKALAELPHIRGVKDSSGSPELMGDLVEWADGTDFGVYVGLDSLLYDAVRAGARGAIFGAANLIPGPLSAVAASLRTDGPTAANAALWREIRRFLRFVEVSPNYMAICKAGLALQGLPVGPVREPYLMPEDAEIKELGERLDVLVRAFEASALAAA
jgi:4-hydroxy-tetrahydrodipicolinate synthase